jgi:two-component system, NtrC family, sensor kinase
MRIATRLILVLGLTTLATTLLYMLISHQERSELLRTASTQQTRTLARTLQQLASASVVEGRLTELNATLDVALSDEEVFAAVVLDARGEVLAGSAGDIACLVAGLPLPLPATEAGGWVDCHPRAHWIGLPLPAPAASLIVAHREVLLNQAVRDALRRQLVLTLTLLSLIVLAVVATTQRMLVDPLEEVVRGIRQLPEGGGARMLTVNSTAVELRDLVTVFNGISAKLREKQAQLLHETEERVEVERRLREAERFALIGRLSGGLAHELGSPLSVMMLRTQSILANPALPASDRAHATEVATQIRRVTDFIQSLLLIGRRQGIIFASLDLIGIIEEVVAESRPPLEMEGVSIETDIPEGPVLVRGQETLLRHAVRNLLRNAWHAVRHEPGERRIRLRLVRSGLEVRLLVEDNGPGIEPHLLQHATEPFFTTKDVGQGTGLGLPIALTIAEKHGGELHLENMPERGFRATLVLPAGQESERSD